MLMLDAVSTSVTVGDVVGLKDGLSVGENMGDFVGSDDGFGEGGREGMEVKTASSSNGTENASNSPGMLKLLSVSVNPKSSSNDIDIIGDKVGEIVEGLSDGETDEFSVGESVGTAVGLTEGLFEGELDGMEVNTSNSPAGRLRLMSFSSKPKSSSRGIDMTGEKEGVFVEGLAEGLIVGLSIGDAVGTFVGMEEGEPEGMEVNTSNSSAGRLRLISVSSNPASSLNGIDISGDDVGAPDDGLVEGENVGLSIGDELGEIVGPAEGGIEGEMDGMEVKTGSSVDKENSSGTLILTDKVALSNSKSSCIDITGDMLGEAVTGL